MTRRASEYQYCVMHYRYPDEPHRLPPALTDDDEFPVDELDWCIEWVRSWEEDFAPDAAPGIFYVARRPVGKWEALR